MGTPTQKQEIGSLGEDIAAKYLENKGFSIITRNYRKKWGEIDIIAEKSQKLHFIEVKSVSCENILKLKQDVSRVTDGYRPEDNIHPQKLKRLARTIQSYLFEKYPKTEPEWLFDAVTVKIDKQNKGARVKFIENIII